MTPAYLPNFGYLTSRLPENLFEQLKLECYSAERARYSPTNNIPEIISGLTGNGVAKHYDVVECASGINSFVSKMIYDYDQEFKFLPTIKYYNRSKPFKINSWINIQEKHEFIPNHEHAGVVSFVIWVKIPYDINKELAKGIYASTFEFTYANTIGTLSRTRIPVSKDYEGYIMMFPANMQHCVYPFYTSNDRRISVSGNLNLDVS